MGTHKDLYICSALISQVRAECRISAFTGDNPIESSYCVYRNKFSKKKVTGNKGW